MMRVMGENVLVKTMNMEKQTESGVIVAQQHDRHDHALLGAQVIQVGKMAFNWEKKEDANIRLPEPGDYVLLKKFSGVDLELPDGKHKIVSDSDVLAITDEETIEGMRKWTKSK